MRTSLELPLLVPALALAAACTKAVTKRRTAAGRHAPPPPHRRPPGRRQSSRCIYNPPKDPAAFEKYYTDTHVPLVVANQNEIGFTKAELTKFASTLDGKKPTFYRQAELYFDSMDDLKKGVATAGFKKVGDDLTNSPPAG